MRNGKQRPLEPWRVLRTQTLLDAAPWVRVERHVIALPDGKRVPDYHFVRMANYTCIVAETTDGRLIMERQYKHGVGKVSLTFPGGYVEPGERLLPAAQRELLEETGYVARQWKHLGTFVCSANYGCGRAHIFSARHARQVAKPCSGDLEEMELLLLTPQAALRALRRGEVVALGVATALALSVLDQTAHASKFRTRRAPRTK